MSNIPEVAEQGAVLGLILSAFYALLRLVESRGLVSRCCGGSLDLRSKETRLKEVEADLQVRHAEVRLRQQEAENERLRLVSEQV